MKPAPNSKPFFSKKQMKSAIAVSPDEASDPAPDYDPNDPKSVAAYWAQGKVRLPQRVV
jgi:hypothetical protein